VATKLFVQIIQFIQIFSPFLSSLSYWKTYSGYKTYIGKTLFGLKRCCFSGVNSANAPKGFVDANDFVNLKFLFIFTMLIKKYKL
jgi:hypothetical protein